MTTAQRRQPFYSAQFNLKPTKAPGTAAAVILLNPLYPLAFTSALRLAPQRYCFFVDGYSAIRSQFFYLPDYIFCLELKHSRCLSGSLWKLDNINDVQLWNLFQTKPVQHILTPSTCYRSFSVSGNKKIKSKPFNEISQKLGML